MFFFGHDNRSETFPRSLQGRDREWRDVAAHYTLDPKERLQTDVPPVWKSPLDRDLLDALTALSYGKCPFCEQAGMRLQPYRFRPPAYATPMKRPEDKECYLWLAFQWENLFPICEGCLPRDKAYFPSTVRVPHHPMSLLPPLAWWDCRSKKSRSSTFPAKSRSRPLPSM